VSRGKTQVLNYDEPSWIGLLAVASGMGYWAMQLRTPHSEGGCLWWVMDIGAAKDTAIS